MPQSGTTKDENGHRSYGLDGYFVFIRVIRPIRVLFTGQYMRYLLFVDNWLLTIDH